MLSMEGKEIIKKAQGCATLGGETERGISLKENGMDEMPDVANQGELGILRESCLKKLIEVCGKWKCDYWIEQNCKEMLDDMPEKLYQNVWEWIRDEPISEIMIGELSIKRIMESNNMYFIKATRFMMQYVRNGCRGEEYYLTYYETLRS